MDLREAVFQAIADPASSAIAKYLVSNTIIIAEPGNQDILIAGQVSGCKIFKFPVYSVIAEQPAFYSAFKVKSIHL